MAKIEEGYILFFIGFKRNNNELPLHKMYNESVNENSIEPLEYLDFIVKFLK